MLFPFVKNQSFTWNDVMSIWNSSVQRVHAVEWNQR